MVLVNLHNAVKPAVGVFNRVPVRFVLMMHSINEDFARMATCMPYAHAILFVIIELMT